MPTTVEAPAQPAPALTTLGWRTVLLRYQTQLLALSLFLLALAVRLPGLDVFFTADEFLWVDRSRNFLGGLISPEFECLLPFADKTDVVPGRGLACTLRTGHPGVVTMWTGSLGIWLQWLTRPSTDPRSLLDFVQQLPTNPVERETIAPVRLPTVFLSALFVVLVYLLLRKLFRPPLALLAGLLIALNPFHVALSRVLHHDALSTTFMIPAALCLILYFGVERRRRWLILAGVSTGGAWLAKSTGLFLLPYAGLLGLWSLLAGWARGEEPFVGALWRRIGDGLLWLATACLTFFLLWPAMWVSPLRALDTIYTIGFKYASGGHAKGVLFWGTVSRDPGPFFYPVMWFFRTNFWAMLGLVLALVFLVVALRQKPSFQRPGPRRWLDKLSPTGFDDRAGLLLWIGAFVFFFMIAMTLGEKKQDRYVLPSYPMLDIMAAVGLFSLVRQVALRRIVLGLVLLVNLSLLLPRYPYYFTYYNPLVGGIDAAARLVTIGWGEGLNLAADYLNGKPDAARLKAASWYGSTFAPFFAGETIRYSDQKGQALAGEYVIFYVNQVQRMVPDEELWRYFNEHFALEQTVTLAGVDYAWIFTGPAIAHPLEDQRYTGIAELLGWDWFGLTNPDDGPVAAGSSLDFALFWEYLGKTPEEDFFVRLLGPDDRIWAAATSEPIERDADPTAWRQGQIIEERGRLTIPPQTPPGRYSLQIGFYTAAPAVPSGELTFPTPNAPLDGPLQVIEVLPGPADPTALDGEALGDLVLLTRSIRQPAAEGQNLNLELIWAAPAETDHAYEAAFALLDGAGVARWRWPARELIEFLPTSDWPPARPLNSRWNLPLTARTPGGSFHLQLTLSDETGPVGTFDLGGVMIPGRERSFVLPSPAATPVDGRFAEVIALSAYQIGGGSLAPGERLSLTLYWEDLAPLADDYTVFVQLIGPDNQVYAQQDKEPLDGRAPTSTWAAGEVVSDTFQLTLPDSLPVGTYRLISGFYLFETGKRLPAAGADAAADFVTLRSW